LRFEVSPLGQPISDVFFVASSVVGITVENNNYDPDAWKKFARKMTDLRSNYEQMNKGH